MKAGLYARVSTVDKNQDPELQLSRLREYAKMHDWEIIDEYVDYASGAKWDRPKFQQLLEDVKRRRFEVVLVTKIDRFTRSLIDLVNSLELLKHHNVAFITIDQPIDTSTASGILILHVLGSVAEFERELIRERVKEGMEKAKREGKKIGRRRIEIPREALLQARQESDGTIRGIRNALEKQGIRVSIGTIHRMIKEIGQSSAPSDNPHSGQDPGNSSSSNQH